MAVILAQLQQRLPFVDADGRLTTVGLRALNDSFKGLVDAIDAVGAAQAVADGAAVSAGMASDEAAAAQGTANDALTLAGSAVQQDVGPAWAAATGIAARSTFASYSGQAVSNPPTQAEVQAIDNHLVILSQRFKALIDDLKANGALT